MARLTPSVLLAALFGGVEARIGFSSAPFIVKLWKEHAHNVSANGTLVEPDRPDHGFGYFVGAIQIGSPVPQELHVAFSTTAGMVVLPSSKCSGSACKAHRRYNPETSESSWDVQLDGRPVDEAGGRRAQEGARRDGTTLNFQTNDEGGDVGGVFVSDVVCVGDRLTNTGKAQPSCSNMTLVVATSMDEATFKNRPADGMVGLGLSGLSLGSSFNFVDCLGLEGLKEQFSIYVADDAHTSEIVFGGYDHQRVESGSFSWVPVVHDGHWIMNIKGVSIDGMPLEICRGEHKCVGLVDTSSPGLVMPEAIGTTITDALDSFGRTENSCALPTLSLELEDDVTLTLGAEDYAGPKCEPEIRHHHMQGGFDGDLILLGEPLLRRYYTTFDWRQKKVGFARARVERSCARLKEAWLPTDAYQCGADPLLEEDQVVMAQTFLGVRRNKRHEI